MDDVEKGNPGDISRITYPPPTSAARESTSHHPEPATRLPIEFRTVSIRVETRVSDTEGKEEDKRKRVVKELTALDWHKITTEEALTRLAVSPKTGLDKPQFDRSILTGESEAVYGRVVMTDENFLETKNVALQGTHCVSGSGVGLVVQTGDKTVFGAIAKLSSAGQTGLTTLQKEILRFVIIIGAFAIAASILVVVLWAARLRRSYPGTVDVFSEWAPSP